jgi:hypothetical protein
MMMRNAILLIMMTLIFALATDNCASAYVPWDELTEASWIDFGDVTLWQRDQVPPRRADDRPYGFVRSGGHF